MNHFDVVNTTSSVPAEPNNGVESRTRLPEPTPAIRQPRKLDLNLAAMPLVGDLQAVSQLAVRELKKIGQMFTANLENAFQFPCLVYKPADAFDAQFQIVTAAALLDPRIARLTQMIAFIPAFAWDAFEVVLMPMKLTAYGQRVLAALLALKPDFPDYKAFVQWDSQRRYHVVYRQSLTDAEKAIIATARWPNTNEIVDALELVAFDTVDALCAANDDIRGLLSSREVS